MIQDPSQEEDIVVSRVKHEIVKRNVAVSCQFILLWRLEALLAVFQGKSADVFDVGVSACAEDGPVSKVNAQLLLEDRYVEGHVVSDDDGVPSA